MPDSEHERATVVGCITGLQLDTVSHDAFGKAYRCIAEAAQLQTLPAIVAGMASTRALTRRRRCCCIAHTHCREKSSESAGSNRAARRQATT